MKDLEVVPECCAKFVVTEPQENTTEFQAATAVEGFSNEVFEGKFRFEMSERFY